MTSKSHPASNRQIVSEASTWFVSFRYDSIDESMRVAFSEWLRRSPEHIQAYLDIAGTWMDLPDGDPERRIDVAALVARARAARADVVALPAASPTPGKRNVANTRWIALAASLACALVFTGAWFVWDVGNSYRTHIGEQRSIVLSDGSTVDLNSQSRIRVRFTERERVVELTSGQALFEVTKDPARPFVVRTDGTQVRAIGTRFDVYRKSGGTVVTVVEGRVAVTSAQASTDFVASDAKPQLLYVSAGEQVAVTPAAPAEPVPANVAVATAWLQKKLIFEATPLREVAEEFNRHNRRQLLIEDEELASLGISGVYSSVDPTSLLRFLRSVPGVRVIESEREIRLTRVAPR